MKTTPWREGKLAHHCVLVPDTDLAHRPATSPPHAHPDQRLPSGLYVCLWFASRPRGVSACVWHVPRTPSHSTSFPTPRQLGRHMSTTLAAEACCAHICYESTPRAFKPLRGRGRGIPRRVVHRLSVSRFDRQLRMKSLFQMCADDVAQTPCAKKWCAALAAVR
jgi:hypothetical protein